jgi:hypothetical protein
MNVETAQRTVRQENASFADYVTAAAVLCSSEDASYDDLLFCLTRRGIPAEMAAIALYRRTKRKRSSDDPSSIITDRDDWADYLSSRKSGH